MRLRPLRASDRAPLERILRATGAFTEEEVDVALELIDAGLKGSSDYLFVVAEDDGAVQGYTCHGPVALTDGVYDLYWIAVDPATQGSGVGRALMREVEADVLRRGGRMVLIETASKESYSKTRAFYLRIGYEEVARVRDFYRVGDDKVIYGRTLVRPE